MFVREQALLWGALVHNVAYKPNSVPCGSLRNRKMTTIYLGYRSPDTSSDSSCLPVLQQINRIRSCTKVRILPLHSHVAMRLIRAFKGSDLLAVSSKRVTVRTSRFTPAGVTRYLLPALRKHNQLLCAQRASWCSDFPHSEICEKQFSERGCLCDCQIIAYL